MRLANPFPGKFQLDLFFNVFFGGLPGSFFEQNCRWVIPPKRSLSQDLPVWLFSLDVRETAHLFIYFSYIYIYSLDSTYVHLRWPNNLIFIHTHQDPQPAGRRRLGWVSSYRKCAPNAPWRQAIEVFSHQIDALFNRKKPRFHPVSPSRDCGFHISLKIEFSSGMMLFVVDPICMNPEHVFLTEIRPEISTQRPAGVGHFTKF